ncbi:caspase, EACC1-associated type [Actinacidiphila oryziradicis]|uniref:Caspase family protein n=1 Tax=Actinacidiphila oryziradicis TaxID=2571141 RepID=A0A4U0SHJ6_9ACTN|nr:caspase family protein [Actinacidiphila oryziradicis]TKA08318.1 caspase family protein [Actinacidiphila oryziradicis]
MPATTWPPLVPGRLRSAAVLVGTATHVVPGTLPPLPQAEASVAALAARLTGPLGLLDPSAVHCRIDPQVPADVLRLLPAPGGAALDLCLFYFAGHGVLGEDQRLCLALPGSVDDERSAERTSLPVAAVFQAMRQIRAEHKVAIIDCCFSGRALDAPAAADIHLLTAVGRTRKALSPERQELTGFTGALLRLLAEGVPDGPEHLDLTTVYRHLAVTLPGARLPAPLQRAFGASGDLAVARNPAHGTSRTRQGLLARARFAEQVKALGLAGRPRRSVQAALLFEGIASDAVRELGPTHYETLLYRHVHASATGESGNPRQACALLERTVADWETVAPAGDTGLEAARASRDHWRSRIA